jgi:non-specific serine/threonine protein kinase
LFGQIAEPAPRGRRLSAAALTPMTRREREIAQLVCDGLTNKEIAQRLNIATFTVKSHIHNMLGKFALQRRLQLAARVSAAAADRGAPRALNGS